MANENEPNVPDPIDTPEVEPAVSIPPVSAGRDTGDDSQSGNGGNLRELKSINTFCIDGLVLFLLSSFLGITLSVVAYLLISNFVLASNQIASFCISLFLGFAFFCFLIGLFFYLSFWEVPVGFRGVLLKFGDPQPVILSQGYHILLPVIYGAKIVEIRKRTRTLDNAQFFTQDNINLRTDPDSPSVTISISNPFAFLGIDDSVLKTELDNAFDQAIRQKVRKSPLKEALGLTFEVSEFKAITDKLSTYGIKVETFRVPSFKPVNQNVLDALEAKLREELEKAGERVEIEMIMEQFAKLPQAKYAELSATDIARAIRIAQGKEKISTTIDRREYHIDGQAEGILALFDALRGAGLIIGGGGRGGGKKQGGN